MLRAEGCMFRYVWQFCWKAKGGGGGVGRTAHSVARLLVVHMHVYTVRFSYQAPVARVVLAKGPPSQALRARLICPLALLDPAGHALGIALA